jgi:cytochrome c biogenesis protein ResB
MEEMRAKMVKPSADKWRLWLGLGLGGLAGLNAVLGLSIAGNLMLIFLAVSALIALVGLIQFSLWSKLRRSWL